MAVNGGIVWITGMPATGKTTLAAEIVQRCHRLAVAHVWLDSDDLRPYLTPGLAHESSRDVFYRAIAHVAHLAQQGGVLVIISATAPRRDHRDDLRRRSSRFVEIHLRCARSALRQRDIKGLYAASDAGRIAHLPGEGIPYESPTAAELTLDTTEVVADAIAARVCGYLEEVGLLPRIAG